MQDINYEADRKMGDQTTTDAKRILGESLIEVASDYEDTKHNTDLIFVAPRGEKVRFPMRMRRGKFSDPDWLEAFNKYRKYEFTIRCEKADGSMTECHKLMGVVDGNSYGDFMVYGYQSEDGSEVLYWVVIDLNKFVAWRKTVELEYKPADYDPKCGKIKLDGKTIGCRMRVEETDINTGRTDYDYFYAFDWRKIPGIVVACSENLRGWE